LLAAVLQSEEADQVGRGLEHQLPQLYSHVGAIVVVQRATDEEVEEGVETDRGGEGLKL
jgi:hypothetical protein